MVSKKESFIQYKRLVSEALDESIHRNLVDLALFKITSAYNKQKSVES